jgi:hypothetical protein
VKTWLRRILCGLGLLLVTGWISVWALGRTWRREFDEEVRRLEQSGAPVKASQLAPPPIPDEQNAALPIAEAALLLEALQKENEADWDQLSDEEGPDFEFLKSTLGKCREPLDKLALALGRPRCRFPVDYAAGCQAKNDALRGLLGFARALNARALLSLEAGDSAAAARDLRLILRLSECLSNEPFLVSQLVRYVIVERAFEVLKRDRLDLPADEWKDLSSAFEKQSLGEDFVRAFLMERATAIDLCRNYFFLGRVPRSLVGEPSDMGSFAALVFAKSGLNHLRVMGRAIDLVRRPYVEARLGERQLRREVELAHGAANIVTGLLLPAMLPAHQKEARAEAQLRMAGAFCRIKADGRIPESLELGDPCTGKSFLYTQAEGGFELRSPGLNLKDDGRDEDEMLLKTRKK